MSTKANIKRNTKRHFHPGATLREIVIPDLGISQVALAEALDISRQSLIMLLNEKRGVTAAMAVRLSKVVGSSPEFWMRLQARYDIAKAERDTDISKLTRLQASSVSALE
jgi:addiction module HigA family antidote